MIGNITKIRLRSYICASSDVFLPSISSLTIDRNADNTDFFCAWNNMFINVESGTYFKLKWFLNVCRILIGRKRVHWTILMTSTNFTARGRHCKRKSDRCLWREIWKMCEKTSRYSISYDGFLLKGRSKLSTLWKRTKSTFLMTSSPKHTLICKMFIFQSHKGSFTIIDIYESVHSVR